MITDEGSDTLRHQIVQRYAKPINFMAPQNLALLAVILAAGTALLWNSLRPLPPGLRNLTYFTTWVLVVLNGMMTCMMGVCVLIAWTCAANARSPLKPWQRRLEDHRHLLSFPQAMGWGLLWQAIFLSAHLYLLAGMAADGWYILGSVYLFFFFFTRVFHWGVAEARKAYLDALVPDLMVRFEQMEGKPPGPWEP